MEIDHLAQAIEEDLEEAKANLSYHLFAAQDKMRELEQLIKDHDAEDYAPNTLALMYVARELTRSLEAQRDTYNNRECL
jgi:hypothetical protein|tara:strand:- start:631 stop:867 length:237 start_codon:yes stop_codon:yes gene_type:complete